MNPHVIAAIFRRNFVSYFSNPTGYVFICVFVLLGSFAAFWPDEFFNANLANLDQLNHWFPYIMLVFIPAITMSIWADERRQGTDELLLTIPAADIDVVLGKYFSGIAIFSVSLLFSLVCNLLVLRWLGAADVGLFLGTYFGYWWVGIAMLAMGMVASFLTSNLTVAFILGVAFCAPLVFLNVIDGIVRGSSWTATAKGWSIGEQMGDFSHGVISLSSIMYFVMIAVVMLYLCMVLIGRRHWLGGSRGRSMGPHFLVRALALVAVAVGINLILQNWNVRADVTQERLNSVSPESTDLIAKLDTKRPVVIDAFVSANMPEEFVHTKVDLLNLLREFEKTSHGKIQVHIFADVEPHTEEAQRAEQQFGITAQDVLTQSRGVLKEEQIFLGAAITCGLEKIVIPFFERGIPVEYELVRSLATVSQQQKKRIGIVQTDAELFGGFDLSSGMPRQKPKERLVEELEKQYDVIKVDASQPITDQYDVLLAIQPSSLTQPQMTNFIEAVKKGQPTAIFEDPMPAYITGAPPTGEPRRPKQQGMFGMMQPQQAEPKGDIKPLWDLLGVELLQTSRRGGMFGLPETDYAIVWQDFKPKNFEGLDQITPEYVFVEHDAPPANDTYEPFNPKEPITTGLQALIMPLPGGLVKRNAASTNFSPLLKTGTDTGTIMVKDLMQARQASDIRRLEGDPTHEMYVLAAHITGKPRSNDDDDAAAKKSAADKKDDKGDKKDEKSKDETAKKDAKTGDKNKDTAKTGDAKSDKKDGQINVVLVADVDMLASLFFDSRARRQPDNQLQIDADNVTFVLNALDILAGDTRFITVRSKRPQHRGLEQISKQTEAARKEAEDAVVNFKKKSQEQEDQLQKELEGMKGSLQAEIKKMEEGGTDARTIQQKATEMSLRLQTAQQRLDARQEQLRREAQKEIEAADARSVAAVRKVQDGYKLWSVLLPPIPPLVVAFFVYFYRRSKEREGVSKARLR